MMNFGYYESNVKISINIHKYLIHSYIAERVNIRSLIFWAVSVKRAQSLRSNFNDSFFFWKTGFPRNLKCRKATGKREKLLESTE